MRENRKARLQAAKLKSHFMRLCIIGVFFSLLLTALIARMIDLTIWHRKFLQHQGDARSLRVVDIPAHRGIITDRNGNALAASTQVQSLWVNPKEFDPDINQIKKLAALLNTPVKPLIQKVIQAKNREFLYLQRQLPPNLSKKIAALKIPGMNLQQEFKRYYPEGDSISQLLGFTNIDDQGIEGLELVYQNWLMGVVGKRRVVKDRMGHIIEDLGVVKEPRSGNELRLSIDRHLQYLAYNELNKTLEEYGAKSGTVVVVDTRTGEILAMVNAPSYNPNARGLYTRDSYRNRAVTDTFEPGSVIKPFSIASALESGFKPDTIIDTNPGWMSVHGRTVRDVHNYGVLNITGVLQHSSNIGVTKMVLASPPENLISLLSRCGFGQRTESAYPGESEGNIVRAKDANPFVHATLSFGYGMSSTALQLVKAYLVFANKGNLIPVTLLHNDKPATPIAVMSKKTAQQVLEMMEAVLSGAGGTGKTARVAGYRVAGKTGTAKIAGKNGYAERRYIAAFVGIAPVSNPRLAIAVVIHEPTRRGYYASAVAAPLFSKVMSDALRLLDIPPDAPQTA